jgi:hypothetical protein
MGRLAGIRYREIIRAILKQAAIEVEEFLRA